MNFAPPIGYREGQHINKPPLFNGQYYSWWKAKMEVFIQSQDYELWNRVVDGPIYPTKKDAENNDVQKEKDEYEDIDFRMLEKNAKAKLVLICGLGPDEYNRISNCTTAKQIWDTLMNVYEGTGSRKWSDDKNQSGCYKCDKIEWKKERAENEAKERASKQKDKEECTMVATWGSGTEASDTKGEDEIAFMAIGDSDLEDEEESEVSILDLKEKLHLFSKRKLIVLMNGLIEDFQELSCQKDQLFKDFSDQKFECLDIENCLNIADEENCKLKKQVEQLDSLVLNLKSEILKLTVSEKGKSVMSESQKKVETELKQYKIDCFCEKEKVRELDLEISRLKLDLERANRWTHSSRIVNHLGSKNHNEKAGIGFNKESGVSADLCYICGKTGHPTTECPVANGFQRKNAEFANKKGIQSVRRHRSTNLLPGWAKRDLIHPFLHKKGPKLVWVPKTNP